MGQVHVNDLEEIHAYYTALSYAWSDTSPSIRVAIEYDGCKIAITPILLFSLQRIRIPFKPTAFLCTDVLRNNQGTAREALHERGSQVTMMRNIFSKACFVLVELGSHRWDALTVKNLERYAQFEEASWRAAAAVSKTRHFETTGTNTLEIGIHRIKPLTCQGGEILFGRYSTVVLTGRGFAGYG
jgi:hypothetical protein